jgi:DNA-binding beta-propeller fold protein YncE
MRPTGFDLDLRNGTVLVSDSGNVRIQRLTLGPNARTSFINGIGLDDEEKLVVEPGNWVLAPATVEPGAIARDATGRLVIADTVGRRVVVLDSEFRLVNSWGGFGDGDGRFRNPVGLALDPAGSTVYVLDAGQRRVQAFGLDGRFRFAWGGKGKAPGTFAAPSGMALGKDGSVYVVDRGADRVQRFDRRGGLLSTWGSAGSGPGQFRKPEAVHVDGRGRVIVIDSGNRRAQVFTSVGRFVSEFSLDPATMTAAPLRRFRPARTAAAPTASPEACRASLVSNGGRYSVCVTTVPDPVPLNAPFAVNVSVYENSTRGALARNVILDVDATMPEHHHGMTLTPQVRALDGPAVQELLPGHGAMGNGRFEVRGMLFHMPGRWEFHFDITHGAITERAQLELELD